MEAPDRDAERTLTPAGRREVAEIAGFLASLKLGFRVVASSPLKRALETAEITARKLRMLNRLEEWDQLRPTADTTALYDRLSRFGSKQQVLIVGHEPYLSGMIGEIIGTKGDVNLVLKKGGLAKVRVNGFKPTVSGELRWLLTPKLMRKIG